jgi:NAD(P)-dependent dehydrogenase (short-subunit alcohol dehydrogenase family)
MRKVLITGATSGFGKLLVQAFLSNGDYVIASGRNLSERKEIFEEERSRFKDKFMEVSLDVTNSEQITAAVTVLEGSIKGIDILINNAGHGLFGALEDLKEEEIRYQMEVNFFGTVGVTKAFLPQLRKNSKGMVFNFSSVFGFMGFPLTSLYCASKYAVEGLTESLRAELAPHGVQVCLIGPGGYKTGFGNNLAWSGGHSVYKKQFENYQALRKKVASRNNQDPKDVSEGVLQLSLRSKLPMRKVFGKDGKVSYYLKRALPSLLYFKLMDFVFHKIFLKNS